MGLFDFAKNIGKRLGIGDDAPDPQDAHAVQMSNQKRSIALTGALKELGLDVEGLRVVFADGTATLHGEAGSSQVTHKLIVALGNYEGVGRVDSRLTVRPAPQPEATEETAAPVVEAPPPILYTVKEGDTLSLIAKAVYGPIHLYPAIFEANQPMIKDIDEIFPGQVLTLPADPAPLVHTVKRGETLGKIARYHYGDSGAYVAIFEANKDKLDSPDRIDVGQELTIPLLRHPGQEATA